MFSRRNPATFVLGILVLSWILGNVSACVHEPILPDVPSGTDTTQNPIDTTGQPGDTTGGPQDTTHSPGDTVIRPCDPDTVYFERDVLPILVANCALSGCHNAASAEKGVILTDYSQVMATADVRPRNLDGSDLYEVITETRLDKRMPPPPASALSSEQVGLIRRWIMQGAQDLSCGDTLVSSGCDTDNMSYQADISPILTTYCRSCHSGSSPSAGIDLSSHASVAQVAQSGALYGVTARLPGWPAMPDGGAPLPACEVSKLKSWIDAGAPNN